MRLTLVQPAIGHRIGETYIRSWQMEPLPIATLAGLTPPDVDLRFYDDRMETIAYDQPTDAVAIPVETYTARRAYQIASEFRRRGVPVILGGFHPSLVPDEAQRFGDAIVIGEAEGVWPRLLDDLRHGTLQARYESSRGELAQIRVDRRLFRGKRYLPVGLIETGRGCRFPCEFCAIQSFFGRTHRARPAADVIAELAALRHEKRLFFFVDDNFAGDMKAGKVLLPELAKLDLRWITQLSINAAHDEEFVAMLARGGCRGVLIGFESLDAETLRRMKKGFNLMKGGYRVALDNLRRHGIAVYGTFVFGYDNDDVDAFDRAVDFAQQEDMYIAAFNHLTPFPGTPLYRRLAQEGRLRYESWWLDPDYRYNDLPYYPGKLSPAAVTQGCVGARRRFYAWGSIAKRAWRNRSDFFMLRNYLPINLMHQREVALRNGYPLGDEAWRGPLLEVA
ncbi:MAG: radical SAM protein [Rhodocyclales bacterium GT-UBC]|nr:MAG: radical SAM protein [Rhodocyclales bacterium GT-UBC]